MWSLLRLVVTDSVVRELVTEVDRCWGSFRIRRVLTTCLRARVLEVEGRHWLALSTTSEGRGFLGFQRRCRLLDLLLH